MSWMLTVSKNPSKKQLRSLLQYYQAGRLNDAEKLALSITQQFPKHSYSWKVLSVLHKQAGRILEALAANQKIVEITPLEAEAHYNLGNTLQELNRLDEAVVSYKQAITLNSNFAEAYNNLANALKRMNKLDEAVESYKQAVTLKPDYPDAHNNLGVALQELDKFDEAAISFNQAITLNSNFADAYYNLGNALQNMGILDEAVESYKQAVTLKPNYPDAYNNLGNAYQKMSRLEEAKSSYKQAIKLKSDYTAAFWNLSGCEKNIDGAERWVDEALKADENNQLARLTKAALLFYQGDKSDFDSLMQSKFSQNSYMRSFSWALSLPNLPELHFNKWYFFDAIVKKSIISKPFYEFGVWRASSFKYLIKFFKKGYGFDTFSGLPEDWLIGSNVERKGRYSSDGNVPKIKGGEFIVGKFEDTLPIFFSERRPKASVINFDADLYSSTICALNFSKPVIDKDTILIFDEFIMNESWEQDEFKALNEFCSRNQFSYEVVAISFFTKQVAVKLIGI